MKAFRFGLMIIGILLLITGCKKGVGEGDVVNGGRVDYSDKKASKVIKSEELIYFQTSFHLAADEIYNDLRDYSFQMTTAENGNIYISEGYDESIKCQTDGIFVANLAQLIKDHNLAALNGVKRKTYGLPPEFDTCSLSAEYASGEVLSFYDDGDPNSDWTNAVFDLFAKEFTAHGINDLLPPKEDSMISRFSMEYTSGDLRHLYGEVQVPIKKKEDNRTTDDLLTNGIEEDQYEKKAYSDPVDRSGNTELLDTRMAAITPEHYIALGEIVNDSDLLYYVNGKTMPDEFDSQNTPAYFNFTIEYENGKVLQGFSDDSAEYKEFLPIAERFASYYEEYLEKNQDR